MREIRSGLRSLLRVARGLQFELPTATDVPGRDAAATVGVESGQMAIVVLRELRKKLSEDFGPGDPVGYIKAVHTAPLVSGAPGDRTLCGKPTPDMERVNHQPTGPDGPCLPLNMQRWECRECAAALRLQ
ncbi:hypothetical protein ACIGMX_45585 [Streptomyces aquilus]|uniref:hypothetical protein n=1 Tax=Streptomyces aquilus TaxID=2548456 RepID=UPI0037CFFC45